MNKRMRMNSPVNPLERKYWEGFNDGKMAAINEFAKRFERLQEVKGIGEKTIRKMIDVMKLPVEVKKK